MCVFISVRMNYTQLNSRRLPKHNPIILFTDFEISEQNLSFVHFFDSFLRFVILRFLKVRELIQQKLTLEKYLSLKNASPERQTWYLGKLIPNFLQFCSWKLFSVSPIYEPHLELRTVSRNYASPVPAAVTFSRSYTVLTNICIPHLL